MITSIWHSFSTIGSCPKWFVDGYQFCTLSRLRDDINCFSGSQMEATVWLHLRVPKGPTKGPEGRNFFEEDTMWIFPQQCHVTHYDGHQLSSMSMSSNHIYSKCCPCPECAMQTPKAAEEAKKREKELAEEKREKELGFNLQRPQSKSSPLIAMASNLRAMACNPKGRKSWVSTCFNAPQMLTVLPARSLG